MKDNLPLLSTITFVLVCTGFTESTTIIPATESATLPANPADGSRHDCKPVPPAKIDVEWFDKISEKGWDSPISSRLDSLEKFPFFPKPPPEESLVKFKASRCYNIDVVTALGSFPIPFYCRFDEFNEQYCLLKTEYSAVDKILRFFGNVTLTLSDNKAYVLAYVCLGGVKDYWAAIVPRGDKLSPENEASILAHLKSLSISTEKDDMKKPDDAVSLRGMTKSPSSSACESYGAKGTTTAIPITELPGGKDLDKGKSTDNLNPVAPESTNNKSKDKDSQTGKSEKEKDPGFMDLFGNLGTFVQKLLSNVGLGNVKN